MPGSLEVAKTTPSIRRRPAGKRSRLQPRNLTSQTRLRTAPIVKKPPKIASHPPLRVGDLDCVHNTTYPRFVLGQSWRDLLAAGGNPLTRNTLGRITVRPAMTKPSASGKWPNYFPDLVTSANECRTVERGGLRGRIRIGQTRAVKVEPARSMTIGRLRTWEWMCRRIRPARRERTIECPRKRRGPRSAWGCPAPPSGDNR